MPIDKTIFGHRFSSNESLRPTQAELRAFLDSPKKDGTREPQRSDLAKYAGLARSLHAFKHQQRQASAPLDCREKMLFGVLNHSQIVRPGLQSAVEHYKYYAHALRMLDFKKPMSFIASAEEEMDRLDLKTKNSAVKLARFQEMVNVRKKMLRVLNRRWLALDEEMINIARYIRSNLSKIAKLCEIAMGILMNPQSSLKIEQQLIEDVKTHFKKQLKDSLRRGAVTSKNLETAKQDVAALSKEITLQLKEDVNALLKLYDAILDHVTKIIQEIDALLENSEGKIAGNVEADRELFSRLEQIFVSLVSDYQPEGKKTAPSAAAPHQQIGGRREELLDLLFELLQKERRSQKDRRANKDRRRFTDRNYPKPDRRRGSDRRSGEERRESA